MKRHQMIVNAAPMAVLAWFDPAAQAEPSDAAFSAMLMKDGIEAYSQASARGDERAAEALLDDDVLFAGGDGSVQRDDKRDRSDPVAAMLKEQTIALRRADAAGELARMRRQLMPGLPAVGESGTVMEGDAYRPTADFPLQGAPVQDAVTGWVVHYDGKTAVAFYIDERTARYGGQILRFRSMVIDAWVAQQDRWRLFATHAIPLFDDPGAVSDGALDAYAGDYAIGPGAKIAVSHDGAALLCALNGAKPTRYAQEWPDVFFALGMPPGSARTCIFGATPRGKSRMTSAAAAWSRGGTVTQLPTRPPAQTLPPRQRASIRRCCLRPISWFTVSARLPSPLSSMSA